MAIKIQHRRDTSSNWTSTNPTPHEGELCFETNTGKTKIGDGSTAWTSLAYIMSGEEFTTTLKNKLDAIEASADVTDATNVTAAGALMDSEVTNLADVKAFATTDYATSAQGTTADAALPTTGGAMTGAITTTSTFDGRDVATDGTKLDGIEVGATADQTKADIEGLAIELPAANLTGTIDAARLDTAATQTAANNSTKIATTAYVETAVAAVVNTAPAALDTLNELAAALGDDANFATTTATSLGEKLPKAGGEMTGNITMASTETVDGRDLSVDGAKLDLIEASATADQTGAEIKTAYELEADTNAYNDAAVTKLAGIEASADVTDATNVTAAGALMDSEVTNLADVKAFATTDYATAAQGTTADAALPKAGGTMTGNLTVEGITETVVTGGGTTPNLSDATVFVLSSAGTVTMPTASAGKSFTVVVNTGTHVTWGGSISWNGGAEPTKSAGIDTYVFICANGSTWLGAQSGTGYA